VTAIVQLPNVWKSSQKRKEFADRRLESSGFPVNRKTLVDTIFNGGRGVCSRRTATGWQLERSKQQEIYLIPFPGPRGKRQISTTGGTFPRWRHDGKEIFYVGLDGKLMAAEVTLKASNIEVGQVKPLGIAVPTIRAIPYDVSLDGQRILAFTEPKHTSSALLTLLQNWTAILKK